MQLIKTEIIQVENIITATGNMQSACRDAKEGYATTKLLAASLKMYIEYINAILKDWEVK
jgi:hypothetical protein